MDTDAHRRLEDVLDREIEAARSLAETLDAERAALTGDSPEAVELKAADKSRILHSIEALDAERRALCGSPGAPQTPKTVAERWRALIEILAGCRKANEVNGHIIHVRRHQVRQLIDIVRGGPAITYGPQGKTMATALRALARA